MNRAAISANPVYPSIVMRRRMPVVVVVWVVLLHAAHLPSTDHTRNVVRKYNKSCTDVPGERVCVCVFAPVL